MPETPLSQRLPNAAEVREPCFDTLGMSGSKAERAQGFTLIELLVSLALLAMVALMLTMGVGSGKRVWERLDARSTDVATIEAVQDVLRSRLEGMVPITRYDASSPYADIRGTADLLTFVAPSALDRQPDALADYRLSLSSTGGELVLSSVSDLAPTKNPPRDDRFLLRHVARLDLAYFGTAPPDNLRRWRDRWYDRPSPPELIRVRLAFAPGDKRRWPDLLVHPAATVDTQCVLNNVTGQCKGR